MGTCNSGSKMSGGQTPTNAVQIENMNEAQLNKEIAKSDKKLQRLQKIMDDNKISIQQDIGAIPLNQLNGYNDKTKNSAEAKRKADKQINTTVKKAVEYTKASEDYNTELKHNNELNKALKTVKGTGKTTKQLKDEAVKKKVADTVKNSTMKWNKSTEKGQFGNVTVRKSGAFEIHTTGGTSFIYKDGKQLGMTNSVKKAITFVELYNKRGK